MARRGYVAVTALADPARIVGYKADGKAFVDGTQFVAGSRYADFDSAKDKVAEYGLAGLIVAGVGVGVVKAAKVGLLAAFVAIAALLKRIFGGKKRQTPTAPTA